MSWTTLQLTLAQCQGQSRKFYTININVIKRFVFVTDEEAKNVITLVPGNPIQPSLIFQSKAKQGSPLGLAPGLKYKCHTNL